MSINNIARAHSNRLEGENSIAAMCFNRLKNGEPEIVGAYKIDGEKIRSSRKIDYRDPYGKSITRAEAAELLQLSTGATSALFQEKDDVIDIYCNHGPNRHYWQEKLL